VGMGERVGGIGAGLRQGIVDESERAVGRATSLLIMHVLG
jgi:hypothetical protein